MDTSTQKARTLGTAGIARLPKSEQAYLFKGVAQEYMEKHNCRWSEACLQVKRKYPEARAAFGAPAA